MAHFQSGALAHFQYGATKLRAEAAIERSGTPFEPRPGRFEASFEAFFEGHSVHCGVRLHDNDRQGIETPVPVWSAGTAHPREAHP